VRKHTPGRLGVESEEHEAHFGELFPRVGFIVTNLETPSRSVVCFYNKRGMAEQWIKEGKQAVKMTRLSCHRFRSNQVRLALSLLAYNLGNLWRRLTLPKRIENWSLSLQQRLVKTGGRLVKHARYYWLMLAEGYLTKRFSAVCSGGSPGCCFRRDSWGCRNREIDPEPRGDGKVSDKTGWGGRGQQLATHIATVWTLAQAFRAETISTGHLTSSSRVRTSVRPGWCR
jgi:hypothetical protein